MSKWRIVKKIVGACISVIVMALLAPLMLVVLIVCAIIGPARCARLWGPYVAVTRATKIDPDRGGGEIGK
jgi:hypothetical protein